MPSFLPLSHPLAAVNLSLNSVYIKSDLAADTILTGHGAGGKATASAVISDIGDILRDKRNNLNYNDNQVGQIEKSLSYGQENQITSKYIWHSNDADMIVKFQDFVQKNQLNIESKRLVDSHQVFIFTSNDYDLLMNLSKELPKSGLFMLS